MADISIIHEGSTDYNVKDAAGRLALAEVEDKGAKNNFDLDTSFMSATKYHATASKSNGTVSITSTGNYGRCAIPYTFKAGASVFSCTISSFTQAGGTSIVRFAKNSDATSKIAEPITISENGKYNAEIVVSSDTAGYIILYINGSGDSYANSANFSDLMICSKAEWDISQAYVPYAPTNRELYEACETKVTMQQAYGDAILIPANSDLNNYTTPGIYYAIVANVPTIANTPYRDTGLRFVVEKNTPSGAAVFQTIYPTSRTHLEFFRRIYEGGSWSSWYKFEGTEVT